MQHLERLKIEDFASRFSQTIRIEHSTDSHKTGKYKSFYKHSWQLRDWPKKRNDKRYNFQLIEPFLIKSGPTALDGKEHSHFDTTVTC